MAHSIILIGGMSRSGKSTLASDLARRIPNSLHIDQDDYVKDQKELGRIKGRIDWEQPSSLLWDKLIKDIDQLKNKNKVIIVEGIFAFCDQNLNEQADFKIYLDITKEDFLERRALETRWGAEPTWYLEHVWQAHQIWKNPYQINYDFTSSYHQELAIQILSKLNFLRFN